MGCRKLKMDSLFSSGEVMNRLSVVNIIDRMALCQIVLRTFVNQELCQILLIHYITLVYYVYLG